LSFSLITYDKPARHSPFFFPTPHDWDGNTTNASDHFSPGAGTITQLSVRGRRQAERFRLAARAKAVEKRARKDGETLVAVPPIC
jgi:hypothetical protein